MSNNTLTLQVLFPERPIYKKTYSVTDGHPALILSFKPGACDFVSLIVPDACGMRHYTVYVKKKVIRMTK